MLRTIAIDRYENKDTISSVLALITKRNDLIVGNDQLTSSLGKMMSFEMQTIFNENSSDQLKNRFWHVLSDLIDKTEPQKFF